MDKITIDWMQTNWTSIINNPDTYFYAFSRGENLVYIGITYKQDVIDEIRQRLKKLQISKTGLSIWLGYIDKKNSTHQRISSDLIYDAESLMIYMNQPFKNTHCKSNYTGRNNLRVVSRNLLKHRISCDANGNLHNS